MTPLKQAIHVSCKLFKPRAASSHTVLRVLNSPIRARMNGGGVRMKLIFKPFHTLNYVDSIRTNLVQYRHAS